MKSIKTEAGLVPVYTVAKYRKALVLRNSKGESKEKLPLQVITLPPLRLIDWRVKVPKPRNQRVEIGVIFGMESKKGIVEFSIDDTKTQWDITKAREIHRMLGEAIEAAISDSMIFLFMRDKVGLSEQQSAQCLADFRELRQGSKDTVYHN